MSRAERRIVSVLFGDVSGFTAMSEALDPEDVREVMNRCFGVLSEIVYAHGGVVDKYVGDCVMALFGVPKAKEDDAVRAVRAALKMQEALAAFSLELARTRGLTVSMRVGVNTGLVVAGDVGGAQKADFTVMGDVVNTASRIEHHAAVGKVWIGADTQRFVRSSFRLKKLKPLAVKGKKEKLQLYEVEGPAEAGDAEGLQTAFLGRDKELKTLTGALGEAMQGRCQVASLIGEAGLGKTTLVSGFLRQAQGLVDEKGLRLFKVSTPPGGLGAYGAMVALGRKLLAVEDRPPDDDPRWKDLFFLALERALLRLAGGNPALIVLEDLHFADAGSWELLGLLVARLRKLPVMLLCAFRPEAEGNLYWHSAESYVPVHLKPFDAKVGLQLLDKVLGRNRLPKDFKETLAGRAAGNPYFLTELAWTLTQGGQLERSGGAWVLPKGEVSPRLPETVQAALLARLDQLPARSKTLLQAASVLGFSFNLRELLSLVPGEAKTAAEKAADLEDLVTRRFLTKSIRPGESAETYEFVHALLKEVCCETLLKAEREALHRAAVSVLEESHPEPSLEVLKRLADHAYEGGDKEKAFAYSMEVARLSAKRFALDEAIQYYSCCLDTAGKAESFGGVPRSSLLCDLGALHIGAGKLEKAVHFFEQALKAQAPGDPQRIEVYRKLGRIRTIQGRSAEGLRMFVEAVGEESGLPGRQRLELYYEIAANHFRVGQDGEAMRWLRRIVAEAPSAGVGLAAPGSEDIHEWMPAFTGLSQA